MNSPTTSGTTTLRKTYSTAFVLDRGKLTRIMSILEQRMPEIGISFEPAFQLKLSNGKEVLLHDIQEVLALDNAVKNPIMKVEIRIPSANESAAHVALRYDSGPRSNVSIVVAGANTKWATEVFAELEEQVERSFATPWIQRYALGPSFLGGQFPILILTLVGAFFAMGTLLFSSSSPTRPHDPSSLLQRALSVNTDQDKLQVIFDKTVNDLTAEMRQEARATIDMAALLSWRTLFMGIPVIVILGSFLYLALVCYPWAVFAWGDWEQEYTETVARRKMIWTVVIIALLLGIITNLFVLSLSTLR